MSVPPPPGEQDERQAAPRAGADGTAAPADPPDDAARAPDDFEDRWRRALADLANLRKRYARDLARERAAERARVARTFLPVLDTIDLALEHADADPATIVAGVRAIRDQ